MRGKKLKKRKFMMFIIAAIIGIANISMYSGNEDTEPLVIVNGEIDVTKTLEEQTEKFTTIEVTKKESDRLGESVVRNIKELHGKRIPTKLSMGSPIPKDILIDGQGFGQFASETKRKTTVFKLPSAITQLPSGVKAGDKIDIAVLIKEKGDMSLNMLMSNVTIHSVTETDVYVIVSQKNAGILTVANKNADFVLQLPGQKDVPNCSELATEDREKEECFSDDDELDSVKFSEILEGIKNGEILNKADIETENTQETVNQTEQTDVQEEVQQEEVEDRKEKDELLNNFNN